MKMLTGVNKNNLVAEDLHCERHFFSYKENSEDT